MAGNWSGSFDPGDGKGDMPLPDFQGEITGSNHAPDWHDQRVIDRSEATYGERRQVTPDFMEDTKAGKQYLKSWRGYKDRNRQ